MTMPRFSLPIAPEFLVAGALAGIAGLIGYSNFQQAQSTSDVAMAKMQLDILEMALDAYALDNGAYPNAAIAGNALAEPGQPMILERLSTPIAYVADAAAAVADPFAAQSRLLAGGSGGLIIADPLSAAGSPVPGRFYYSAWNSEQRWTVDAMPINDPTRASAATAYALSSAGPDLKYHGVGGVIAIETSPECPMNLIYDPTNGTVSFGSIYVGSPPINTSPDWAAGEGLLTAIELQNPNAGLGTDALLMEY
jgi:type II secretory pathway pseudopilin PulG